MKAMSHRHGSAVGVLAVALVTAVGVAVGTTAADARSVATPHPPAARTASAGPTSTYVPVTPRRIMDTKSALGAVPPVALGTTRLQVGGVAQIPSSGVAAVVLTVTVSAPGSGGYLTVFADGTTRPVTSNLNFAAGQTLADQVYAPVGSDGKIAFYNGSRSSLRLIADVTGYFASQAAPVAGGYVATTPSRILDTRSASGVTAPAGRATLHLPVLGRGPVPASGVSAVALTLTALSPTAAGYLTAYADGSVRPPTSNLDFATGHTIGNMVIAAVGADGAVAVYNGSAGTTQLVADVSGYFLAGSPTASGTYVPITPTRSLAQLAVGPRDQDGVFDGGSDPLPRAGVSATVLNVTVTGALDNGYAVVWEGGNRPATSNVSFSRGQAVAGQATVAVPSTGNALIYNGSDGAARLTVDLFGYFVAPPGLGAVSGTVIGTGDGKAVAGVSVIAYLFDPDNTDQDWSTFTTTTTGSDGTYVLSGLPAGRKYWVCFDTRLTAGHQSFTGYRSQCWDHVAWASPGSFNGDPGAALINVAPGDTTADIDARLATVPVGGISGKVTAAGSAVAGVHVDVRSRTTPFDVGLTTNSSGAFSVTTLPGGSYQVCFSSGTTPTASAPYGYVQDCRNETVTTGAVLTVNEQLVAAGAITGRVITASGALIKFGNVVVFDRSGAQLASGSIDSSTGDYTVSPLPPASYTVCFSGGDPILNQPYGYVDECYRDVVWFSRFRVPTATTPVAVKAGSATELNATLALAGAISGTVTGPDAKPIANVGVFVFDRATGLLDGIGQTINDGSYTVLGMAPSTGYTVCFNGANSGEAPYSDHGSECWNNVAWDGKNADVPAGTAAVPVASNSVHTGVNATLPR